MYLASSLAGARAMPAYVPSGEGVLSPLKGLNTNFRIGQYTGR